MITGHQEQAASLREARVGLSERVARILLGKLEQGEFAPGARLPTESELARQYKVSRAVIREAVSRLKSDGLLESRQGSGVYVRAEAAARPLRIELPAHDYVRAVIQIVELRRAIEAEAAALAAANRTPAQFKALRSALDAIDRAVAGGADGVEQDVLFHRRIAEATGNPYYLSVLDYLGQFLRNATRVTRANEARRDDFARQVRLEHHAILKAIEKGHPAAARRAAASHMINAAKRIGQADPRFWEGAGGVFARGLVRPPL